MKLVDIKDNITSKQKLVLVLVFLLILISVFTILRNVLSKTNASIDYKTVDEYAFLLSSSYEEDRDVYWTLEKIISEYINSYKSKFDSEVNDLNYYYKALDPDYKRYLGKKKYNEFSNELIKKVVGEDLGINSKLPEPLIKRVNKLTNYDNAYLCELSNKDGSLVSYIGIILNTDKSVYNIFYIN